jgi:hypothetical protein
MDRFLIVAAKIKRFYPALDMQNASTEASLSAQTTTTKPAKGKVRRRPSHMRLDGRSWEYRLLEKTKAELRAHVGPKPSITQLAMIEETAWLKVHLAQMHAKAQSGELMSDHAARQYLAWANSLGRMMSRLGLKGADHEEVMSPLDYMAQRAGRAA